MVYKIVEVYKKNGFFSLLRKMISALKSRIIQYKYKYSPGFYIDQSTSWLIGDSATIGCDLRVGKRCRIEAVYENNNQKYTPKLIIGNGVTMNDDVHIGCVDNIRIGDNVLMASKIYISDHDHGNYDDINADSPDSIPDSRILNFSPIIIGNNVWIGEMVCILPGVTIGNGSIIGAGAIVTKSIPENSIAVGVPAKVVKRYDRETQGWKRND